MQTQRCHSEDIFLRFNNLVFLDEGRIKIDIFAYVQDYIYNMYLHVYMSALCACGRRVTEKEET